MEIYVLDTDLSILDVIDSFESNIWTIQYFSQNDFELIVPATPYYIALLQKDRMLCRGKDREDERYNNVMVIENINITTDWENGDKLKVTGKGLKSIVGRRIVWKQTNLTGSVEEGIRKVITENMINPADTARKIEGFLLEDEIGITDTFDVQLSGENIAEWIETTCQTYGIGWDVYINNKKYIFKMYKGTDRSYGQKDVLPVVFSDDFDNLLSSSYSYEKAEYKNAALVGGEGEGISQRTTAIGDAAGLQRYEMYIDGSGVSSNGEIITEEQYYKLLQNYGKEQLSAVAYTEKFEGNVEPSGNYTLNKDYFLGDIVQVRNEYGISAAPRIIEIIESEDENGASTVPTFSTWEV